MKILFATLPADGHFNPLTGLAVHLREKGHDVRWYTGPSYAAKLASLGVPHLPLERATDVNGENLTQHFPEYERLGGGPKAIAFALEKIFFGNLEAHYRDITALHARFPFEAIVCDGGFYAARLVSEKLGVHAYVVSPSPTPAPSSQHAPPPFFSLRPARTPLGRLRDRIVSALVESSTRNGMKVLHDLRAREGLPPYRGSVFDLHVHDAASIFQVGVPGMDFPRDDWPPRFQFVGALLPRRSAARALPEVVEEKLARHDTLVVVSQGTIDNRDPDKLFAPSLAALAGTRHLVVACTGGRHTDALRARFTADNVVVEDWIDFDALLPHADLFICNGGYGSVLQALALGVPLLVAGALEGKGDINARLDFRGLALDLRTERPTARQTAAGVARVLGEPSFAANAERVRAELAGYDPLSIIERAIVDARRGVSIRR